jgi:hypothetical protein
MYMMGMGMDTVEHVMWEQEEEEEEEVVTLEMEAANVL